MTNVIDIRKAKPSFEEWLEANETEIMQRLPYATVVEAPKQVTLPKHEYPLLPNEHIAALYSLFPGYRVPTTTVCLAQEPADLTVQVTQDGNQFAITIFQQKETIGKSKAVQHMQYALLLVRAIAETIILSTWQKDPDFELRYGSSAVGFYSDDIPQTTGRELIERFAEIASTCSPISQRANHYRKAYGTENGEMVLKEAAEVLAVYVTQIAYNGPRKPLMPKPFIHHGITRVWCEDFLGVCYSSPSKH